MTEPSNPYQPPRLKAKRRSSVFDGTTLLATLSFWLPFWGITLWRMLGERTVQRDHGQWVIQSPAAPELPSQPLDLWATLFGFLAALVFTFVLAYLLVAVIRPLLSPDTLKEAELAESQMHREQD